MPLLTMPTREQVDPEVRALWDECERTYPAFKHLWATQANSPIIFRHVWGQLLELKRRSPVAARHFEIGIVVASALNRCRYCVSHHAPLAEAAGLTDAQVAALARLTLEPLAEDHDFPLRAGFAADDSLVVDLAYFLVWSGIYPHDRRRAPARRPAAAPAPARPSPRAILRASDRGADLAHRAVRGLQLAQRLLRAGPRARGGAARRSPSSAR